ncbi:MAG: hypothetical protein WC788_00935 [Candidatus Paceibacterota bacterium]|jgi:hypothetical protein
MKYKLKIEVIGVKASLFLLAKKGNAVDELSWIDSRDLAEKILENIEALFVKNHISIKNISEVVFDCDSPYYKKKKSASFGLENENSKGKCGFTSWQIGEMTAKTLNYCLRNKAEWF